MLPTIDIGGRWVPTLFVRRASGDTAAEVERMRELTVDLSSHDGLLIYPEGTRWTPEKLARAKQIIAERQPEIAPLAARLRNLLPPRLGGTVELLRVRARRRRRHLRPLRPRWLRVHQRHLVRRAGRHHRPAQVLALPRSGRAARTRQADRVAVRALAGARRLDRGDARGGVGCAGGLSDGRTR